MCNTALQLRLLQTQQEKQPAYQDLPQRFQTLDQETLYYIRIRVNDGSVPGDWSAPIQATTKAYAFNLKVESTSATSATLKWDANVITDTTHLGFEVRAHTSSSFPTQGRKIQVAPKTATTTTITGLSSETLYYFQISATYTNGTQTGWTPVPAISAQTLIQAPTLGATPVAPYTPVVDATYSNFQSFSSIAFHNNKLYAAGRENSRTPTIFDADTGTKLTGSNKIFTGLASHNGTLYALYQGSGNITYLSRITITNNTYTSSQIGSATHFGVNETAPYGLASHNNKLYMIGALRKLYTVNTTTGVATEVGGAGTQTAGFSVNETAPYGLASDGTNLYMIGQRKLYTLNTSTGVATEVGGFASNLNMSGLTYKDGNLYAVSSTAPTVYIFRTTFSWNPLPLTTPVTGYEVQYESGGGWWITATPSPITTGTSASIPNLYFSSGGGV